ncbi:nitrite reductase small subunit NirD [Croceicoccus mobilis]|uniref:tRNA-(Guanine-N1)-methyltransferase n=1 Tax=Croceicoccus mobilis TaxID=1703339 RepID=A0A917DSV9_9SPHN|nr:nitrite reductase small subunit NirD [Croceicoccus mobilis]GGD63534.1 tRNA-(guanine-N1)-methyltransferase [Croceicoccus mobilis]
MNAATPFTRLADAEWVRVGTIDDIPRQGARCVKTDGPTIAVFRTEDDRIFAMQDNCPHRQGPLSQGIVHGNCVTCPLHNWVLSLETGLAQGADEGSVPTYAVRLEGRTIHLNLQNSPAA